MISLEKSTIEKPYKVVEINAEPSIKRRFLDIGIIPGAEITKVLLSPFGKMAAYYIMGTTVAIRDQDAKTILVKDDAI